LADTYINLMGKPLKLIDNGDGTFSVATDIMKDFATSAKQDIIITHIDGVETALTTLNSKDLATQTTLAQILAKIIDAPATEAKQTELNALIGEVQDVPTANTLLARLKNLETKVDAIIADGIKLSGSIETVVDNPATGIKTITATAAELFAGAYAKPNRRKLIIKNEDQSLRFRIGKADITQQNGFPVEPGAVVIIPFDPAVMVPIYAISEGASLQASVMEV
jgi:hypothetical protein